jgi:hypothetical protein
LVHPHPHGRELIRDIHAGVCGHHATTRTLAGNAFYQGFYWPTTVGDANEVIRTYEGCQFYARKINIPAHALQMIPVTCPFVVWGLEIVGPLRKAPRGYTHLLVTVDKFSKWIEACPVTNLRAEQAVLLTPKIGTGKRLTCGPSLVEEHHSTEDFPQSIQ